MTAKKILQFHEEFNKIYPYLKIELFLPKNSVEDFSKKKGKISIAPNITVKELKKNFKESFGIKAKVFRKSGSVWLETNVTDNWTLEEQNHQGEVVSRIIK